MALSVRSRSTCSLCSVHVARSARFRDIKPANILVTGGGVKRPIFGIAKNSLNPETFSSGWNGSLARLAMTPGFQREQLSGGYGYRDIPMFLSPGVLLCARAPERPLLRAAQRAVSAARQYANSFF